MPDTITGEARLTPRRTSQETKAENTTRIAREMIEVEAASREAKTAKLREARLAREAQEQAEPETPVGKKKAARPARRAASR